MFFLFPPWFLIRQLLKSFFQAGADKVSRDSGVISPSDNGHDDTETDDDHQSDPDHHLNHHPSDTEAPLNNALQVHDTPTAINNQINSDKGRVLDGNFEGNK